MSHEVPTSDRTPDVDVSREAPGDADADRVSRSWWARFAKRPFDLVVGCVSVVLVSPLLLLIIVAIKVTSPGPLLFRQTRTGIRGESFSMLKFRSMRADRKPDVKELVPLHHPEITAVGRMLRRFKLDELPQVFNVIAGDMSLVGPRPTIPHQTERYSAYQRRRLLIRPGLTGLAQVNSSAMQTWDERIDYDVYYVRHHGFWMDGVILCKTVLVVAFGEERFARPFVESPYGRRQARDVSGSR